MQLGPFLRYHLLLPAFYIDFSRRFFIFEMARIAGLKVKNFILSMQAKSNRRKRLCSTTPVPPRSFPDRDGIFTMPLSRDKVLSYIQQERPLKLRELAKALRVPEAAYRDFRRLVRQLEREGALVRLRGNRYGPPDRLNLAVGRLSVNPDGFGFVARETGGSDIFVGASGLGTALHADRVVVRLIRRGGRRSQPEGEVVRVLERAVKSVVGTYRTDGRFSFVEPDDPRLTRDFYISPENTGGAKGGQTVVAQIDAWSTEHPNPEGRIVEVLGNADDPGIDVLAIIKEYDLPVVFPPHVQAAVDEIPDAIPEAELSNRLDLRDLVCVTIDPEDAQDFDDAVSLEALDNGAFRLGVHIADVSFYVREGAPLDHEALTRGTSVYLPDRVIPMLPERLSSGLCSLRPNEDRLALSVLIRLDTDGRPLGSEIVESVIHSRARFTYGEVQNVLDGKRQGLSAEARQHAPMLVQMESLRRHLTQRRRNRGALDFDIPEPRIVLDEAGNPIDVQRQERLNSHRLIEEFMLLANETVAGWMGEQGVPILYRVHDRPDRAKLAEFAGMVAAFGHRFPDIERIRPADIQEFLVRLQGKRAGDVLNEYLLRSMKKAVYTPVNIGHFGLACDSYTHFTSPIRRYPDLLIHRLVREVATGTITDGRKAQLQERLPALGDLATRREVIAQEAQWDAIKVKQIRFLQGRIGEQFNATIVNVRPMGFFAQLDDYLIDGLVRVSSLEDDYYIHQETRGALVGERTGKVFQIGDPVVVELAKADLKLRRIDFLLVKGGAPQQEDRDPGTVRQRKKSRRSRTRSTPRRVRRKQRG